MLRLHEIASGDEQAVLDDMLARMGTECGIDPYITGPPHYWLIEANKQYVGFTGVHSVDWRSRRARGIIWIEPDHRRNGYAEKAVMKRNNILFDVWNLNRIEWAVAASNRRSMAFSQSRGYAKVEGYLSEAVYFAGRYHDVILYGTTRRQYDSMRGVRDDFTNPGQNEPSIEGTHVEYPGSHPKG